jgi:hypothetical protein
VGQESRSDKALQWLVYAPVGASAVLRDMAPGIVTMLAGRGKNEIDKTFNKAESKVTHYRQIGQLAVMFGPAAVRRRVETGIQGAWMVADGTAQRFFGSTPEPPMPPTRSASSTPPAASSAAPAPAPAPTSAPSTAPAPSDEQARAERLAARPFSGIAGATGMTGSPAPAATPAPPTANDAPAVETLAIPNYDGLSASQVVDRLVGLPRDALEAVRAYESGHRARRTVLGKISQLTA